MGTRKKRIVATERVVLDQFFTLEDLVHSNFGYKEDWVKIPLVDHRKYFWRLEGEGPGEVLYADTKEDLADSEKGNYYSAEIYTQRFLPKWVYRTKEFTLIAMDTHTDGNHYLGVFDNANEQK